MRAIERFESFDILWFSSLPVNDAASLGNRISTDSVVSKKYKKPLAQSSFGALIYLMILQNLCEGIATHALNSPLPMVPSPLSFIC